MKNAFDGLIVRWYLAEERICKLENRRETSKIKKQREKKTGEKLREHPGTEGQFQCVVYA